MIGLILAFFYLYRFIFGYPHLTGEQGLALSLAVCLEGIIEWGIVMFVYSEEIKKRIGNK